MASTFDIPLEKLPETLPVFPLNGVILLPGGVLPLNIFEPRYINMINDAMGAQRLVGVGQPVDGRLTMTQPEIYKTACAGRIIHFQETEDGRYLITLKGICRFDITDELPTVRGYRRAVANFDKYTEDLENKFTCNLDRSELYRRIDVLFRRHNAQVDWRAVNNISITELVDYLAQNLPFETRDKQALLEAENHSKRAETLLMLIDMELASVSQISLKKSRH